MMETPPWYFLILVYLTVVITIAMAAAFLVGFILMFCEAWRKHKRDNGEEEDEGGGGGGWTPFPGPPPHGGGPDFDMVEFHQELDLIGKQVETEKEEEAVLHLEAYGSGKANA